jgi:hypothetical protein
LRVLAIPTRVATGFLASSFDSSNNAYEVWESDRHAWIEVHFEGYGWMPFDPTPGAVLLAHRFLRGEGAADAPDESRDATTEVSATVDLDAVLSDLAGAWGWIAMLARSIVTWIAAGGVVVLWILLGRRRRRTGRRRAVAVAEDSRYERLLRAIARQGIVKKPFQTARELARAAASARTEHAEGIALAIDLFYGAWFGRRALSDAEREFIDRVTHELERARVEQPIHD